MNSLTIGLFSCGVLYLGYRFYGRFITHLWGIDPARKTPALESSDKVDYIAARHWTVLFGHHFASIAGAGPILGPVLACAVWGWLPALIWILVGSIFMGAVHDFSALMASLRARGRSIAEIAEANLGHRVRLIFGGFLWLALILVVAVFAHVGAQSLDTMPRVVIPTFGVILAAIVTGFMMYRTPAPQWLATIAGLAILAGLLVVGYYVPLRLPWGEGNVLAWTIILLLYAYIASITPVNLLLQPRDYLSTFVLYIGLAAGYIGLLLTHPTVQAPSTQAFTSSSGPLWPMMFVIIACGAISGFHSLIASGTTSKQIATEAHASRIGYGAMIVESALAILVLIAVCAGLRWGTGADTYTGMLQEKGPLVTFANGFASLTRPLFGALGALVAITVLKTFVLTTLDSATRIARYIGEELLGEGLGIGFLRNRFASTLLIIGLAFYLALGPWGTVWPVFGSANQLIAALTLLVVTLVLWRQRKPVYYTLVPGLLILATTVGALIYQGRGFLKDGKVLLAAVTIALLVLALMMLVDSLRTVIQRRSALEPASLSENPWRPPAHR
ncbi:MAG: carbon starvation protein A [Armatimonadetes bacterium]|nr:carbon starvation protein A [Armatimonadota bacterium]NIM24063.1 carbon starvation protein A [Armatimonadota bacterium]NIM67917.1 carbon starvation protein A [Armatimonadota bacterium]NIM76439.1 carbon starvation protein A [Armatimonadota bacterium]NIN06147.1 carbon starvation protein A [Armatimonadota bacterium]